MYVCLYVCILALCLQLPAKTNALLREDKSKVAVIRAELMPGSGFSHKPGKGIRCTNSFQSCLYEHTL